MHKCSLVPQGKGTHIRQNTCAHVTTITRTILRGQIKGKAGLQLKCIPEKRDKIVVFQESALHEKQVKH